MAVKQTLEERIEKLETQIAFQDDTIEQLNQSLIRQQEDINRLIKIIERMRAQLESLQPETVIDQALETPPPHY
jgi:SlyX protein